MTIFDQKLKILAKVLGNFEEMNLREGYFKGLLNFIKTESRGTTRGRIG